MPRTPFDYRLGFDQGRVRPATRAVSPDDIPGPAVLVTLVSQTYALDDGDNLLIAIDGGPTQQVIFLTGDFVDISVALAPEVAAVIQAQVTGITAAGVGAFVQLVTDATGTTASFKISGGTSQNALQFPTALVTGTQGEWAFVLGHEQPGETYPFEVADGIQVSQSGFYNDSKVLRMRGAIKWRGAASYALTGFKWRVRIGPIDGFSVDILDHSVDHDTIRNFSLDDVAVNLDGITPGPANLEFGLTLEDDSGPGGPVRVELPAAFFDLLEFDDTPAVVEVVNRDPHPDQTGVPVTYADLKFTLLNPGVAAPTLASTRVLIDGALAYELGAFVAPFTGTDVISGIASKDRDFTIDFSSLGPFTSEQTILVQVDAVVSAVPFNFAWTFVMADTTAPGVTAAQGRDKTTVRAFFSEPMVLDDSAAGVMRLTNYTLDTVSVPAVTANITAAVAVGVSIVDLTVDIELSFGALYRLTVGNVTDLAGNAIDPALSIVEFKGFQPPVPPGRAFDLWNMIPLFDRRRDEQIAGRPLRKFILITQDVANLLLCEIDRWTEIIDIDLAPEQFLDAILCDLGNPFTFVDLDLNSKRRLAGILVDIYKEKGTSKGIINAIRFFLGIEVEIDVLNCRDYWQIGLHNLNLDTVIGPGAGSPIWYSFNIISPLILTDEQRTVMLKIATYMKAGHEHVLGVIEPGSGIV